jgi:hypothetical protein
MDLLIDNFIHLCAKYHFIKDKKLLSYYEWTLERMKTCCGKNITCNVDLLFFSNQMLDEYILSIQNKIYYILKTKKDLPEVIQFKELSLYKYAMYEYVQYNKKLKSIS